MEVLAVTPMSTPPAEVSLALIGPGWFKMLIVQQAAHLQMIGTHGGRTGLVLRGGSTDH